MQVSPVLYLVDSCTLQLDASMMIVRAGPKADPNHNPNAIPIQHSAQSGMRTIAQYFCEMPQ